MKANTALRVVAELSASQWGMVTTAQAVSRGVTRLDLSRLTDAGHLVRLAHGIYRDAGAPSDEFEDLRAAWLSTEPGRLAGLRLADPAEQVVVVAGISAARLHDIGDLPADRHEFVSPVRRQSQRREVHYRHRRIAADDVTVVAGLPVTTTEHTIADLVEDRTDLSLVADALRDAATKWSVDSVRLGQLLAPLAARNGFRKESGIALLNHLIELAGLDIESLARKIAASPTLGALVAAKHVGHETADTTVLPPSELLVLADIARQVANVG